ncbi:MAG: PilZ domain-containing protein [Desulfocapsaceae bacterium]|nr:PilZ domain-containing protein [Desulfocapsaceae bacterium]
MAIEKDDLDSIPDAKPVRIFIPLLHSKERYRMQGVYQKSTPPRFNLLFKAGALPVDAIDVQQACIVNVDLGGPSISVEAMISEIADPQQLNMIVRKSISHEQMRDFFRIDATAHIISSSFHPEFFGEQDTPWSLTGKTIDISGSGMLATFSQVPPMDTQTRLEITLPAPQPETISVIAHPVRMQKINDNQFEVAYQFDDISTEDRDKIVGCCLFLQRILLRLKVRVKE